MSNNTLMNQKGENVLITALVILLLAGTAGAVPAEEWNMTHIGTAISVLQTSDGGYIVLGSVSQPYLFSWDKIPGNDSVRLLEYLKKRFNVVWTEAATIEKIDDGETIRVYTGTHFISLRLNDEKTNVELDFDDERQNKFIVNSENGELKIYASSGSSADVKLVKTDANGILQWTNTYSGTEYDNVRSFQQTSDGGYIVGGYSVAGSWIIKTDINGKESWTRTEAESWIIKIDINGKELWTRTFGGKDTYYVCSVQQTPDDGYIIGGVRSDGGIWVIKTDANGKELWTRTIEGAETYNSSRFVKFAADGGYIISGRTDRWGAGTELEDEWVIKTNDKGEKQWNITLGSGLTELYSIQQTSDNGYIMAGHKAPAGGHYDALLIKLDAKGNLQWNKTYGGTVYDGAKSVQQTSDGGYIFAGRKTEFEFDSDATDVDAWLVKTDANGNEQWNRTIRGANNEEFRSVQQTSDGGYILAGGATSIRPPTTATNFWLVKVGPKEEAIIPTEVSTPIVTESPEKSIVEFVPYVEEWNKTFGGADDEMAESVQQTTDGGYIIVGRTRSYGAGYFDIWIIKTDAKGNELWNRTFGGTGLDSGYSVQQTSDGGYIIGGVGDVWLIKTDANGNKQWGKTFGGTAYFVLQTSDDGYLILDNSNTIVKLDPLGNRQWSKTYGDGGVYFVQEILNGDFFLAGATKLGTDNTADALLIKTDAKGNELWTRTFGGVDDDRAYFVQQTSDGGCVIAGHTSSGQGPGEFGRTDVWLIKTDANGNKLLNRTFGFDSVNSFQQTSDGGYIFLARLVGGLHPYQLVKTDAEGNQQWKMIIEKTNAVRQTRDGGYIISGTRYSKSGDQDAYLLKVKIEQESNKTMKNITDMPTTTQPKESPGFEALLSLLMVLLVYGKKEKRHEDSLS